MNVHKRNYISRIRRYLPIFLVGILFLTACNNQFSVSTSEKTEDLLQSTTTIELPATETHAKPQLTATPDEDIVTATISPPRPCFPDFLTADFIWKVKISYVTYEQEEDFSSSVLWLVEEPFEVPRELFRTGEQDFITSDDVVWSSDGQRIAFIYYNAASLETLSVIDTNSVEIKESYSISDHLFGKDSSAWLSLGLGSRSWSFRDKWIVVLLHYREHENDSEHSKPIIVNTENHQYHELNNNIEFVSWSSLNPDRFLYIDRTDSQDGILSINIGEIGKENPVASIQDLGKRAPYYKSQLSWSNGGNYAISVSSYSQVVFIDFVKAQWKTLNYRPPQVSSPSIWSPDDQWLVFYEQGKALLWPIGYADEPTVKLVPRSSGQLSPKVWSPDSNMLIVQDGMRLLSVSPEDVNCPIQILDLEELEIEDMFLDEFPIDMTVWAGIE